MPVQHCEVNGVPGWRWGAAGHCYTYSRGDEASSNAARRKAYVQAYAATGGTMRESIADWGQIEALQEIALNPSSLAIDATNGVIRDVRILGRVSLNGREYTPEAVRKATDLYEGRPVNFDHQNGQRSVASRFGWLSNVHEANDGLEGDLHYFRNHPLAPLIVETAQRNPRMVGLSHSADGRTVRRGNKIFVEEIVGVRSVDLVADPATTKSLFESQEVLTMDATPDPTASAIAPGNVTDMILSKVREILGGDGDASAKASQIGKVAKALLKVEDQIDAAMSGGNAANDAAATSQTQENKTMLDVLHAKLQEAATKIAVLENKSILLESQAAARAMLEQARVKISDVRIDAIVAAPTPAAKKALIESWPVEPLTEAIKPRSGGSVSTPTAWQPPSNAKETARRLKRR